ETEAALLLNRAMDEIIDQEVTLALMELADRVGQRDDFTYTYTYPKTIHSLVGEARANDIDFTRLPEMAAASWAEMKELLAPASSDDLDAQLQTAITTALRLMPTEPATKGS